MSRPLDSAMPGRPPKVPFLGRERYVFMFICSKNCACGHPLRPEPGVSLYFLMCLHLVPQTGERAIAPQNPTTGALRGTRGSCGTIGWGHRYSAHGERGQSWWRVGWQRLILVVVCCVVCCECDKLIFATLLVEKVEIGPAKMAGFSAFITKNALLDAPKVN
jgi:hypothetical protein